MQSRHELNDGVLEGSLRMSDTNKSAIATCFSEAYLCTSFTGAMLDWVYNLMAGWGEV